MIHIPLISNAIKGWQFASQAFAHRKKSSRIKQQLKSFFLTLVNAKTAAQWFKILESSDFKIVKSNRPELYIKPFRVYMSTMWTKKQRIKVIQDTYRFILGKGEAFTQVITSDSELEITRFKMKDDMEGYLTLGYDGRYRKEGELVLSFSCDQLEGKIVAVAFSFEEIEKDRWVCRIGCVQGHGKNEAYSSKIAQKQLFGLRPKSLVILTVQELSKCLGLTAVYGAGDIIQAYRRKHAIHIHWRHAIKFDYDAFWAESGGQPEKDGWYELPLTPIRRSIQEIKSEKRSLYTKRYRMLDELSLKVADSVKKII
ncbi:MAG TPA: DUF535 family protein [Cytophagaceae bacterium]|jgi:uncharacterized protein VirK/YbjX|nr:DUF535 family protein [Cytophagaceae bacterium]